MALEATWSDTEMAAAEIGCVYVPDLMVYRHSSGREIKPFRIGMVYAAPYGLPGSAVRANEKWRQHFEYMNDTIHSVLRMCSLKEHDEIVLGAWGCKEETSCAEIVADLFRVALQQFAFRRLTFAVPQASPQDQTLAVFRSIFDNMRARRVH